MTFPTIQYKFTQYSSEPALTALTDQKLQTLGKHLNDASVFCEVEFELLSVKQTDEIYRVEVNLDVDGTLYRAEATMDSFEKAIDEVRDELDKELRRANDKKDTLIRRGGRKIKEMLRFGRTPS